MAIRSISLPALSSPEPAERERCVNCLRDRLLQKPGVRNVALKGRSSDPSPLLELEYDPRLIPLHQLDVEMRRAGICCRSQRATVVLAVDGMASPRHEPIIESVLARLPGVVASASFASRSLRIEFDRDQCALPEIVRRLDALGLTLRATTATIDPTDSRPTRFDRFRQRLAAHHKLLMAGIGTVLLLIAYLTRAFDGPQSLRLICVFAGFVLAGWHTAIDTYRVLRQFSFDIDVLMFAAALGAAALGHYEEGTLLLVLFAFGAAGEELAIDKARKAIDALARLAPDTATVRDDQRNDRIVRVDQLKPCDRVVVRPFERFPADGVVETGHSAVDQSPITGESTPIDKSPGDPVFAGAINGANLLLCTVGKPASESTLAKIVRMVQDAQTTKSPTQLFTDKVEKWYVPLVLIATAALIFIPPLAISRSWSESFYRAMAFLTAASPCALAIGTPAAVLSGIARAARIGVLIKGGVHLENLGRVGAVAFDKTGTLTSGKPTVLRVLPLDSMPESEVLMLAASVDATSAHPAASAIVAEARARQLALAGVEDARQLAGLGAAARIDSREIYVGKLTPDVLADPRVATLASDGLMLAQVRVDQKPVGVIALADAPRHNARACIDALRRIGIKRCIMLTGDRADVANAVASQVGIDDVHASLMPEDKVNLVKELQRRCGPIAMIGDGVNDAPALATASVGIAMGGAGTDVAIETADVALMADDLARLPDAIALARFSRRIIRQNLIIALGVIVVLAPLAALGYTYLGVAVLFHEGSTVVVVLNAMRLLLYNPEQSRR